MKNKKKYLLAAIIIIVIGAGWFKLRQNKQNFMKEIAFSSRQIDAIPVKVHIVSKATLEMKIKTNGILEANQQLIVLSETQGKIVHLYKKSGDFVKKGDTIAKVEDEPIMATVLLAEANFEQQKKDIDRFKRLNKEDAITKHDLEQAEIGLKKANADLITAQKTLSNTSVTAPVSGYINQKFITEGQFLSGGMPVCEIVDNDKLKLNVRVTEKDVFKIHNKQAVDIIIPVFPDNRFVGTISAIGEKADEAMNFNVEITMNNSAPGVRLKAGLYAEVEIPVPPGEELIIRKESIIGSMEKPRVFVVNDNIATKKEIVTGESNDEFIVVLSGLNKGEQVIYSGQQNLGGGERIKIIK